MMFDEILEFEKDYGASSGLSPLIADALRSYRQIKEKINDDPFVFYYEDVIASKLLFSYKLSLKEDEYMDAADNARACLNITHGIRSIPSYSIMNWIQSSLKFIDNIVLHYIQDIEGEKPKKYTDCGIEKSSYKQLTEFKSPNIKVAGHNLTQIYDLRNKSEHRRKTEENGRQTLLKLDNKKLKLCIELFTVTMSKFLIEFKDFYPQHCDK